MGRGRCSLSGKNFVNFRFVSPRLIETVGVKNPRPHFFMSQPSPLPLPFLFECFSSSPDEFNPVGWTHSEAVPFKSPSSCVVVAAGSLGRLHFFADEAFQRRLQFVAASFPQWLFMMFGVSRLELFMVCLSSS